MRVELDLLAPSALPIDLGMIHPSDVLSLSVRKIENLVVSVSGHLSPLGEHFKVKRSDSGTDELVLCGDTGKIVSAGNRMNGGRLVLDGDAGSFAGVEMSGGELEVLGNAGDCLGAAMHGGLLRVRGNAGNWCGAAQPGQVRGMTGGTILVNGNVGAEAGAGMRRGLLVIGKDSGEYTGAHLLAGTIICLGQLGRNVALEMKRGSIVAGSSGRLLPGFRAASEADIEWLRICLSWLRRLGMPCPPNWERKPPQRFTGDHLATGKGEVLAYDVIE